MAQKVKRVVFLIEDNQMYSFLIRVRLESVFNLKIYTFSSAEEAMKNIDKKPDIIVLDNMLEGELTGMQAIPFFKNLLPDCFIVFISGKISKEIAEQTLASGATSFIAKDDDAHKNIVSAIFKITFEDMRKEKS